MSTASDAKVSKLLEEANVSEANLSSARREVEHLRSELVTYQQRVLDSSARRSESERELQEKSRELLPLRHELTKLQQQSKIDKDHIKWLETERKRLSEQLLQESQKSADKFLSVQVSAACSCRILRPSPLIKAPHRRS